MPSSSMHTVFFALFAALAVCGHPHDVHQRATPQVYSSSINSKDIALTFDDGPYNFLRDISDQFTAAGAKATFFFNGNNFDCIYNANRVADVQYAYAAGHMVASHTWSHADLTALTSAQFVDSMYRSEEFLSRIVGVRPAFMRPPFGSYNQEVQTVSANRGQSLALWDFDTGDADGSTPAQSKAIYDSVINNNANNALILEHETLGTTANTLVPYAINLFKSKGYKLVTLAECLGVDAYQAVGVPQQRTSAWTCNGTPGPGAACGGSIPCKSGTPTLSTAPSSPTPNQYIHPSANAAKCITAASNANGAAVEIEDCIAAGSASQSWTVSGSTLQIFGNKCLDVTGGATADGTKMQIWTCSTNNANQKWTLSGSTVQWSGHSNCLDLTDGRATNGNIIQIWTCTGGNNQKWALTTGPGSGAPPVGNAIKPGASSTTCLTALSNTNGGTVVVQSCNGASSQSWTRNGGTYVIYGNKCLDVTNGSTANGVKMQIWSCSTGSTNQQFTTTNVHSIQWTGKGKCLDLTDGSLTSGNKIQMWACVAGNTNQVWDIV